MSSSICVHGPSVKVVAFFTCSGSRVREIRISDFDSQQAKLLVTNNKRASSQAKGLVRMGVFRGDSSHKPNSPFHAVSEVLWIIHLTAVIVVGVDKGVDNTHNDNSMLKASLKCLSDEVVKQMVSSRADCSSPPGRGFVGERENPAHQEIQIYTFVPHRPCEIDEPYTCRCKEHEEYLQKSFLPIRE